MHIKSMNASQFAVTGVLLGHTLPVVSIAREEESTIGKDPKIFILPTYSRKHVFITLRINDTMLKSV